MLCDSLNYCVEKKGLEIFSYVIMTNHMQLIARTKNSDLSKVIGGFKKFTKSIFITIMLKKVSCNFRNNIITVEPGIR